MKQPPKRPVAFVLVSTEHGTMLVNRHDYGRLGETTYGVGHQLLTSSSYDAEEVALLLSLLGFRREHFGDGVIAIDCGANIGVHTVEWARFMHGWGEVIAFEAQERIFYALAGNVALNNCFNARAIWAAVGAGSGRIGVPIPDYCTPSSFGSLELRKTETTEDIGQPIDYSPSKTSPTRMMAIDDLGLARVDLIKIDVEGMEIEALAGARHTLEKCRPQLLIEHIKSDEAELAAFVEAMGYKVFPVGLNLLAIHASDPVAAQVRVA
ncbi:MAG TPA: FkbM family methyltransferase [Caulobacteraceae bacterium]|jgi:FkbM family methyltransferase|nr:FkbM family methyltransferase [Caulobacteraceae bacterium]